MLGLGKSIGGGRLSSTSPAGFLRTIRVGLRAAGRIAIMEIPPFVVAGFLTALLAASCSLDAFEEMDVRVEIPALPPSWDGLGDIDLLLTWHEGGGPARHAPVEAGETISIALPRGVRSAVFAEARHRGRPLRPAGAIWPDGLLSESSPAEAPRLELRWFDGWTASVFEILDEVGAASGTDYDRLGAEARTRLSDPWQVDIHRVAADLFDGDFRSDSLGTADPIPVTLPAGGPWFSESPLAEAPVAADGCWLTALPPGSHRFVSRDFELSVAVPGEGEAAIFVRKPYDR